ncbi:MAG: HYR domain-containing protein, partial [Salibacteraceae bacterium]
QTQNLTVYLDSNGQASITAAMVDNGSTDNCAVASLALDSTQFDCAEVGTNTVMLTVTDSSGNSSTDSAIVTVLDTLAPMVNAQNITVYLDSNGQVSITTAMVDSNSLDNCGILSLSLDSTQFDCGEVGANTVTLTVTDVNGNSDSTTATVTVLDTLAPVVQTQNLTIYLDGNGQASITAAMVNDGSTDNCAIDTLTLDSTLFDCSEVGANTVTLTASDVNGNAASATATITVLDTLAPVVQAQNITVYLDTNGQVSITASMIDNGSADNCTIDTLMLDTNQFDCSDVGANSVVLTVSDIYSNSASASATVTVLDTLRPQLIVANDTAVCAVDTNGTVVSYSNSATDNCGTTTINQLSGLPSGSIFPIGITTNVFEAVDASGNITLDSFTIEVYSIPALSMSAINGLCETADPVALNASPAGGVFSGSGVSGTSFDPTAVTPGNHELTYTFTTTQGCSYSTSVFAEVFANPLVQLGSFPDTICIELGQVAAPVATPAGGVYSGLGIDSILLNTQVAGIGQHWITYTYVDANGCVGTDSTLANIDQCLPPLDVANPIDAAATWSVFPNPSQGNFRVQHNFRVSVSARVFALDGSLVQEIPQLISGQEIHLEQQGSGVYFLQLTGDEVNEIKRIVVQ